MYGIRNGGMKFCFVMVLVRAKVLQYCFPSKLDYIINKVTRDDNGRFILLDVDIDNLNVIIVNIYAPTKDKVKEQLDFLQQLQLLLADFQDKNLLIGGDFNTYLEPEKDKKGGRSAVASDYSKQLCAFMEESSLIDVWRVVNPDDSKFTWRSYTRCGFVQSRIDYFLTSAHMVYDLADIDIKPGIKSDHSLLRLSFKFPTEHVKGRGFWKFNASLLHDKDYVSLIKRVISENELRYKEYQDKSLLWDVIKCDVRSHTISYSAWKAKERRAELQNLHDRLVILEGKLNDGDNVHEEYSKVKTNVEKMLMEKSHGNYIRSRSIHIEHNEKSNKYFLQQEAKNAKVKNIKCLKTINGKTLNDPNEILNEQKLFYEKLYTKQAVVPCKGCDFLFQDIPKLTDIDNEHCDSLITLEECGKSLKELANNKAPGTDGFTADFYKFFWINIKKHVYNSFLYSFNTGLLSIDQRRAILTLLPKLGKDLRWLKNWRPLSLLNTDY